jgi:hypothetical protein
MIRIVDRGRSGLVILRDDRDEGRYVLLVCQEFQPSGGGGIIDLPADAEEYPMLPKAKQRTVAHAELTNREPFSLEVDIGAMPRGELRFTNREFIEQAVAEAEAGHEVVRIEPENAQSWGYIESNGDSAQ